MKFIPFLGFILLAFTFPSDVFSQSSGGSTSNTGPAFINLSDTNSVNELNKHVDIQSIFFSNPTVLDEGTNDPTTSGMTLEYWHGVEVYRKSAAAGNGMMIDILYYPKTEE